MTYYSAFYNSSTILTIIDILQQYQKSEQKSVGRTDIGKTGCLQCLNIIQNKFNDIAESADCIV